MTGGAALDTPWGRYQSDLSDPDFVHDAAQEAVVRQLQRLFDELLASTGRGWLHRLLRRRPAPVKGLYVWGGVGRGKTYLVDCFYECLPPPLRLRLHFHRLMQRVHRQLGVLRKQRDPLERVARELAGNARVLCFDEFFVSDIGDAMILAGLLEALFAHGVTLVATSNTPPRELYRDGLQRARFLPAIDLIEAYTQVIELRGDADYRLRFLEHAEIYHSPLDGRADGVLDSTFDHMAPEAGVRDTSIEINGRAIAARRRGDGVIWCDFDALCASARSAADYVELARCFHTVLLSGVPVLGVEHGDEARRFISLVDEFYDRNVKLILTAAAPPEDLYQGRRLAFEFERTRSRLAEMCAHEYLARPHLP